MQSQNRQVAVKSIHHPPQALLRRANGPITVEKASQRRISLLAFHATREADAPRSLESFATQGWHNAGQLSHTPAEP